MHWHGANAPGVPIGMAGKADTRNRKSFQQMNGVDEPVVSRTAIRILTWPRDAGIPVIIVFVLVALVLSAVD